VHIRATHGTEIAALVHRDDHLAGTQRHLTELIRDLIAEAAQAGDVRDDIPPDEMASYCLNALAAAPHMPSSAAVHRLVQVTLAGIRRPR